MFNFEYYGMQFGIVGSAVGAPFAVLVAEQLFASGCQLLISITSSGQASFLRNSPFFVLIKGALRDEGTSYHYLPPSEYATISDDLLKLFVDILPGFSEEVAIGKAWTTDAPFRETEMAIEFARSAGILAVEMEAAALYAFAEAKCRSVVCFAEVTNQMGIIDGDFEKGEADESQEVLKLISALSKAWPEENK